MTGGPVLERLRNLQCQVAEWLGLDLCLCCGRWHRKSRMGLDGLCLQCDAFVTLDRLLSASERARRARKGA